MYEQKQIAPRQYKVMSEMYNRYRHVCENYHSNDFFNSDIVFSGSFCKMIIDLPYVHIDRLDEFDSLIFKDYVKCT